MIKVGIVGATGYMGGELLRVLYAHPQIRIAWATSRQPGPVESFHPNLYGSNITLSHPDDISPCDIIFTALPTEATFELTPKLLTLANKLIDLGASFRIKHQQTWESTYKMQHPLWPIAKRAVYGLSELHFDDIQNANIIANPGCFSSAAILAIAPLMKEGLCDTQTIVINGISGTAGMGAQLSRAAHHPEIGNNLVAYNVVDHRHSYEMEQELSALCDKPVNVHFTPIYAPITRGILNCCHVFPLSTTNHHQLLDLYSQFYKTHPFVKIYHQAKDKKASWQYKPYPWISAIAHTNYCHIGFEIDEKRNRIVIFSVLDSLGKGGAQVAIENMNIMFDLPRTAGLESLGRHP